MSSTPQQPGPFSVVVYRIVLVIRRSLVRLREGAPIFSFVFAFGWPFLYLLLHTPYSQPKHLRAWG